VVPASRVPSALPPQLRDVMREHVEELREITVAEVGAPVMLTSGPNLEGPIGDLEFAAGLAENYSWETDLGEAEQMGITSRRVVSREAVGVVGAITPWNFPHQINLAKLGPALAAGNTVVLKPAPDTPWCAAILGPLIAEHNDIPAGVVNIVTSDNHGIGARLVEDPRVDMISFTGSTRTGREVVIGGAANLKRTFLELGGKSAAIVLDDADIAARQLHRVVPLHRLAVRHSARRHRGRSAGKTQAEAGVKHRSIRTLRTKKVTFSLWSS
jgi:aldehyde dehydrogenase (NAD+)